MRKVKKLQRSPKQFVSDSKAYHSAQKAVFITWAKFGTFIIVILLSLLVVFYYTLVASPRYVSSAQFIIKQATSNEVAFGGLASLGTTSASTKDALIIKEYIQSRDMALLLDESLHLKKHYQQADHDWLSRLGKDSSVEEYLAYFQQHISVQYDSMSEIVTIEAQAFDAEFALKLANEIVKISEVFINELSEKMLNEQMTFAKKEVERSYSLLKEQKSQLIEFQNKYKLYNPEQQGEALLSAINELGAQIITNETELRALLAYMKKEAVEVKAKQNQLNALNEQLVQEKKRLTTSDQNSLNKINMDFQEINLTTLLKTDIYQSSLKAMEQARTEGYRTLKHLLIITHPSLAEEDQYPRRLYNIMTWFVVLLIIYGVFRLIVSIIKEHQE